MQLQLLGMAVNSRAFRRASSTVTRQVFAVRARLFDCFSQPAIDFTSVPNVMYDYLFGLCVNFVHDTIVAYSNPI